MFTQEQIETMPERIYKRLRDVNTKYLETLGKRIAEAGEIIPTDVYKLQRIFESGVDIREIEAALSTAGNMNIREIESLFDDVAKESYNFYKPFYKTKRKSFIPYKDNEPLQKQIEALKRTTVEEYKNLTQTAGFLVYDKNGKIPTKFGELKAVPTTLSETYNITLDNAVQAATMGTTDYQSAMRRVIRALADSGIKTVDYASGYSRRLDTSVRQNILWGIKQCNQEIADMVGEDIGADGYEISYHSNPRPSHADMGGQLYAKGPGRTIKGVYYPSIDTVQHLLDEYGCLHFKFSVILGLSEPAYSKKDLARLKANDNKLVNFEGKEITKYDASQKQRTLETAMRHCDDRMTIAKAADDEILILKETERMRQLQNKYNELSKASGLPTKWERTVSGLKTKATVNKETVNEARFVDMLTNWPAQKGDVIKPANIMKELSKSKVGRKTIEYITNNNVPVDIYYGKENAKKGLRGQTYGKSITIFAYNTRTIRCTSETIIHEVTHLERGIGGSQWAEAVCFCQERKHTKKVLTVSEVRDIIKEVKELYPEYPWR